MDITRYLKRIGYEGSLKSNFETLANLQKNHIESVPFETFDLFLNNPIILEYENLYEKIIIKKRGGYCYEQNGLFYWALTTLGFDVTMLCGRFISNPDSKHMVLLVDLDHKWIVDVGWGNGFFHPIRLDECQKVKDEILVSEDNSRYLLSLKPTTLFDYSERNNFHQKSTDSPFQKEPVCLLPGKVLKGKHFEQGGNIIEIFDGTTYKNILKTHYKINIEIDFSIPMFND